MTIDRATMDGIKILGTIALTLALGALLAWTLCR
jgi:hypothetical protein